MLIPLVLIKKTILPFQNPVALKKKYQDWSPHKKIIKRFQNFEGKKMI